MGRLTLGLLLGDLGVSTGVVEVVANTTSGGETWRASVSVLCRFVIAAACSWELLLPVSCQKRPDIAEVRKWWVLRMRQRARDCVRCDSEAEVRSIVDRIGAINSACRRSGVVDYRLIVIARVRS